MDIQTDPTVVRHGIGMKKNNMSFRVIHAFVLDK